MRKLRCQEEIIGSWKSGYDKPVVSICCITYNHELYIEDTLEGFLIQETDFPFEILIHDDASTDRTTAIIQEYKEKYPKLIKPIFQKKNQYSKGLKISSTFLFPVASGKYISMCEGDDFWSDSKKLQIQIEYMLDHPDCSMTFHAVNYLHAITAEVVKHHRNDNKSRNFSTDELILGGGGLVSTQSIIMRTDVIRNLPNFYELSPAGDYGLVLFAALKGNVHYLDKTMGVYRVGNYESVMGTVKNSKPLAYIFRYVKFAQMLNVFDQFTDYQFNSSVKIKASRLVFNAYRKVKYQMSVVKRMQAVRDCWSYLQYRHKVMSIILLLPLPATSKEINTLKLSLIKNLKQGAVGNLARLIRAYFTRLTTRPRPIGLVRNGSVLALSEDNSPTFFGYHDKTPFSADGSKILAMSVTTSDTQAKNECSPIKLGYFEKHEDGFEKNFTVFAKTTTWCWQQGCMLQWHPQKPNRWVVFNDLVTDRYGAKIVDVKDGENVRTYADPVYSINPNGTLAVTLNFSRLGRLRPGYGYGLLPDTTAGIHAPHDDGLFILNLETGVKKLLVSLKDLAVSAGSANAEHYVNHATFSPDGNRIIFFHLWTNQGENGRGLRVCELNLSNEKWREVESARLVSHYCWRDEHNLFATTKDDSGQWHYTIYDLFSGETVDVDLPFNEDLHPMFHPTNKNKLVIDTYPDKRRDQHLAVVDLDTLLVEEVGVFYTSPLYRGQVRCDLHPRWDREGKYIVVDTTDTGKRKLAVVSYD